MAKFFSNHKFSFLDRSKTSDKLDGEIEALDKLIIQSINLDRLKIITTIDRRRSIITRQARSY
ncbi:hypothetical protein C7B77_10885 [Chamaesiphon polymorphus CCALA 037]|uniref:Uncharacterized protein n=1 Tax=Chamaesiphon polymorphus CCALA 037 TaxID=2107692 RepID=A0A2T1GGU6_9CYAN|nr:hypothetical protein C7B77_10885 [Chamaesiphon polymorphus CCALA 037]